jgi:hypothetical protein
MILTLGLVVLGWLWLNLDGRPAIFAAAKDTSDSKVQRYLRWLIKETEYDVMDGVGQVARDKDPSIYDLFCDLSSYAINDRRMSLSALRRVCAGPRWKRQVGDFTRSIAILRKLLFFVRHLSWKAIPPSNASPG